MTNTTTDPFKQFKEWFQEAESKEDSYPDGFTLATASKDGVPSARTVLLKKTDEHGFYFFTNYNSQKSKELLENPKAHMLFYWKNTHKQIRIRGRVQKAKSQISDDYWSTRSYTSQLNSALSNQSHEIDSSFSYTKASEKMKKTYPTAIPRPENWGGFLIEPHYFEFWEEGDFRWHKRAAFTLKDQSWKSKFLYP